MRNPSRIKTGITAIKRPLLVKGLLVLFLLCIFIKAILSMVSASLADSGILQILKDEEIAGDILSFELGNSGGADVSSIFTVLFPALSTNSAPEEIVLESAKNPKAIQDVPEEHENITDLHKPPPDTSENNAGLFYGDPAPTDSEHTSSDKPAITNTPPESGKSAADIVIDNTTSLSVDIQALLESPLNIKLTADQPAVLIIHTHTSEAYTKTDGNDYEESDPFRTEDKSKNITRVGDELAAALESRGISVIHDRRSYDYPSYTGSYNRTFASVQAYMKEYPSIKLVIDLHRDSITAADGSQYKTLAQIGDTTCSQIMFVVGSNDAGLEHPAWRENLKLALNLQAEMNTLYPSLARPVRISRYRYNQHLTPGSLIVEVGCAGNTLEESLTAIKYFADAAANVFMGFYS